MAAGACVSASPSPHTTMLLRILPTGDCVIRGNYKTLKQETHTENVLQAEPVDHNLGKARSDISIQ